MLFREHRGSLADAMETVVDVADRPSLVALMQQRLRVFAFEFPDEALRIKPYGYDDRIGWDTHIVTIEGYGVAGFTSGPLAV